MYSQDVELAYVCKYFPAQYFCNSYDNKALIPQTQKRILWYIYIDCFLTVICVTASWTVLCVPEIKGLKWHW